VYLFPTAPITAAIEWVGKCQGTNRQHLTAGSLAALWR